MVTAIVLIFFLLVIMLGLCPSWKRRSRQENLFYLVCTCTSFTVLFLRSLDIELTDPAKRLVDLANLIRHGR
ncbi:MAG: hypothetical protein E6X17_01940 [Sporomusaceae bacterium]|nr:hypothetical protein [Sporomusaceae bacterium]